MKSKKQVDREERKNRVDNKMKWNETQYSIIQYNTIQYNTIQYYTIQYNTFIPEEESSPGGLEGIFNFIKFTRKSVILIYSFWS